ncbi:hypothetical protein MBAV_002410, partial [Candidatus Magnetobacterium bavaricum]
MLGVVIWSVMDYFHNKRVTDQYTTQIYERMETETNEDVEMLVIYMKRLEIFTKLLKDSTSIIDYIDESEIKSMLELKYILLIDPKGQIVKSLNKVEQPDISILAEQASKLAIVDKLFISIINNEPFLILKKQIIDKTGNLFGYIILLSKIDSNIMKKSHIIHPNDSIHALEDEGNS